MGPLQCTHKRPEDMQTLCILAWQLDKSYWAFYTRLHVLLLSRRDIDKMLEMLPPKRTRQTVLFSATFPRDTSALCQYALRSNFSFVDTVGDDAVDTHAQVHAFVLGASLILHIILCK